MRLGTSNNQNTNHEISQFSEWLLSIGDGKLRSGEDGESLLEIPANLLVQAGDHPLQSIVNATYEGLLQNVTNPQYFNETLDLCDFYVLK